MRSQSGSEKNRAQERRKGGDGAKFVGEGPGGKAKEGQRPKGLCSALPGQQSQQQEALPWQAVSSAHMQDTVHTHTQKDNLTSISVGTIIDIMHSLAPYAGIRLHEFKPIITRFGRS